MTNLQVKSFFQNKREAACEKTKHLIEDIKFVSKKTSENYLGVADASSIKGQPSQWWHLMSYLLRLEEQGEIDEEFNSGITCGELIFWMAEVSDAVSEDELKALSDRIGKDNEHGKGYWNSEIKSLCWDRIKETVENTIIR